MSIFHKFITILRGNANKSTAEKGNEKNFATASEQRDRQNFTAIFDKYETDKVYEAKLHLRDVKNEQGVIVKSQYWLQAIDARDILGKLMPDEEIAFSAIVEVTPDYADGFKLLEPVVLTKK